MWSAHYESRPDGLRRQESYAPRKSTLADAADYTSRYDRSYDRYPPAPAKANRTASASCRCFIAVQRAPPSDPVPDEPIPCTEATRLHLAMITSAEGPYRHLPPGIDVRG